MSYVTNVILLANTYLGGEWQEERLEPINAWLRENFKEQVLVSAEDESLPHGWYGGSKFLECEVAIGAFNYLDVQRFLDFLKNEVPWDIRKDSTTQVLILGQEDPRFTLHDVFVN